MTFFLVPIPWRKMSSGCDVSLICNKNAVQFTVGLQFRVGGNGPSNREYEKANKNDKKVSTKFVKDCAANMCMRQPGRPSPLRRLFF
jgi:hypothetical protein